MPNLLKECWNKCLFRSKLSYSQPAEERSLHGLTLSLHGSGEEGLSLLLELRALIVLATIIALYCFAGETGNQWFYLLCAGLIAALALGIIFPLFQVSNVSIACSCPTSAIDSDKINFRFSLRRTESIALWSYIMPIKWLLVRANLKHQSGNSSAIRPMAV